MKNLSISFSLLSYCRFVSWTTRASTRASAAEDAEDSTEAIAVDDRDRRRREAAIEKKRERARRKREGIWFCVGMESDGDIVALALYLY
jgi:hypothetical protein